MNVKITMLTADVMDDFSKYIKSWDENPALAEKIEHLAYCSCMGNYGKENRISRFAELIDYELGIDYFMLKNDYEKAENELKKFIDGKRKYFRFDEINILSIEIKKDFVKCVFGIKNKYFTLMYFDTNDYYFSGYRA